MSQATNAESQTEAGAAEVAMQVHIQQRLPKIIREYPVLTRFVMSLILLCALVGVTVAINQCSGHDYHVGREEMESRANEPLEENTYMMAAVSLIRDLQRVAKGRGAIGLRATRIMSGLALLFLTVFIQIAVLICIKMYVTPQPVKSIREVYDQYEFIMYGSNEKHTTLTVNGKHRGIEGYFEPEKFETLDDDMKSEVCNIPFSQLFFFELVLFVWSLTCMSQLKACLESFLSLIVMTPSFSSMSDALTASGPDDPPKPPAKPPKPGRTRKLPAYDENGEVVPEQVIRGLTVAVKVFLVICVYLPWLGTTGFILWLGCRWLAATNDYGDLVLNAVALEFVLQLKELLYMAMVSERSKRDLRNTVCTPPWKTERAGYWVFLNGLLWGYLAILWVWAYIFYVQAVLPEYKWDISEVCAPWLSSLLVDKPSKLEK